MKGLKELSEVEKLRRKVLAELARLAFGGTLHYDVEEIFKTIVTEEGPRYRCCVHKERVVLRHRIILALGQKSGMSLDAAVEQAQRGQVASMPVVNVLPEACDECPIDKFLVTNACRNCLAHNCIASCPKKAIVVVQNRAYIDKNKCVECGLCKKSCAYGAIIEVNRPCEGACDIGAITANSERKAAIDYEKCVQCGQCKIACPFGAIADRGEIVQVIEALRGSRPVFAVLAPAFIGQFGAKIKAGQVVAGLQKLGFQDIREASFGADVVTMEEAREYVATVPGERPFMTTSCCPAFVGMVKQHLPELEGRISSTMSPMEVTAKAIKQIHPGALVVFIGPCVAKKVDGGLDRHWVDYVLTFDELEAMFIGAGVDVATLEDAGFVSAASQDGIGFACAGGVAKAVGSTLHKIAPGRTVKGHRAEGLGDCRAALLQMAAGKIDADFFEGMGCRGGCVGGPGTLADTRVAGKLLEGFAKQAACSSVAPENEVAVETAAQGGWHTQHPAENE